MARLRGTAVAPRRSCTQEVQACCRAAAAAGTPPSARARPLPSRRVGEKPKVKGVYRCTHLLICQLQGETLTERSPTLILTLALSWCGLPPFSFGPEILLFTRYFWSYGATFRFCKSESLGRGPNREARPLPSLEAYRGSLSKTPPASCSSLLDSSSKMYPVSTPGLSFYTCLHAAQLNTPPRSMRPFALERH